jgi:hypothetical protein
MEKRRNVYYVIGTVGLAINLILVLVLNFTVDPVFASVFSSFFPVWIIILVVGLRKQHPRI